jgi:hypothetical protein
MSGLLVADCRQATGRRLHNLHHGQGAGTAGGHSRMAARVVRRRGVPPRRRPMPVGTRRADQQQRARKQASEQCHNQQHDG